MSDLQIHVLSIESGFIEDGYTPHCDCGWVGPVLGELAEAAEAWENHCDVVFMDATTQDSNRASH